MTEKRVPWSHKIPGIERIVVEYECCCTKCGFDPTTHPDPVKKVRWLYNGQRYRHLREAKKQQLRDQGKML